MVPSLLFAQGRGGGMGSSGPVVITNAGPSMPRLVEERTKQMLAQDDIVALLLDHKKPMQLTKLQEDSAKQFRKAIENEQKPLYKELRKVAGDIKRPVTAEPSRPVISVARTGAPPEPNRARDSAGDEEAARWIDAMLPDTGRVLLSRLRDVQTGYNARALAMLEAPQRTRVDSIRTALAEAHREEMRQMRGGRPPL